MSKLSTSLKALINSPAARPHTVPAPKNITAIYRDLQQSAKANNVSQPSWLAVSVSIVSQLTQLNPGQLSTAWDKFRAVQLIVTC